MQSAPVPRLTAFGLCFERGTSLPRVEAAPGISSWSTAGLRECVAAAAFAAAAAPLPLPLLPPSPLPLLLLPLPLPLLLLQHAVTVTQISSAPPRLITVV